MGNLSIEPAVPAADGTGALSNVAALGQEKTIIVDGVFVGSVLIEGNCGGGFVPLATFTAPGSKTLDLALKEIRVVRTESGAIPGTPGVTMLGNDDGALFIDLPIAGTSVDVSTLGTFNTIIADGTIDGVLNIEISQDEVNWVPLVSFQTPGHKSKEFVAKFMRVRHANNLLASVPVVSVGAINDDSAHKPLQNLVSAANVVINAALGDSARLIVDQNLTIGALVNCEPGQKLELSLEQDATGGRTATWDASFLWPNGASHVLTGAALAKDKIRFFVLTVDAAGVATAVESTFAQAFS